MSSTLPIYLSGPRCLTGVWCATCAMIYMGTVSSEPELQKYAQELADAAIKAEAQFLNIDLAERDDLQVQPAVTVGPSWVLPDGSPPMPVCWTHLAGIPPKGTQSDGQRAVSQQPTLIPGKSYRLKGS